MVEMLAGVLEGSPSPSFSYVVSCQSGHRCVISMVSYIYGLEYDRKPVLARISLASQPILRG